MKNSHSKDELIKLLKESDFRQDYINYLVNSGIVYMVSGNGNTMSVSAWKNLMIKLEEKEYLSKDGDKPSKIKCPNELYRHVFIYEDKTIEFGQAHYTPGFNINLNNFKKLLDLE